MSNTTVYRERYHADKNFFKSMEMAPLKRISQNKHLNL